MKPSTHSILIIDDEVEVFKALERTLASMVTVFTAPSGKEGLEIVKKEKISLIICDQRMPEMTGIEFFKVLKESHPDVIRIILTGYTDVEDLIEAINTVGLYRYVTKPWNNHELQLIIQRALEHYEAMTDNKKLINELKTVNEGLETTVLKRTQELNDANKQLGELAITDELTHAYNQRFFWKKLKDEIDRAIRYKHDLSLILLDIDYFKLYNDEHGHAAGDKVLQVVAKTLQTNIRTTDTLIRYGGEEFAIILPETSQDQAKEMAERIRKSIAKKASPFKIKNKRRGITISLGVSGLTNGKSIQPKSLVKKSDQALYQAKKKGRNRVVVG